MELIRTWHGLMFTTIVIHMVCLHSVFTSSVRPDTIPLGAIFDHDSRDIQGAFLHAIKQYNQNSTTRRLELHAFVDIISTADAFKISRLICRQLSRPVWAMVGSVQPDSFDTLHSYANTFQMPFVTPWFPENVPSPSSGLMDYATTMRPDYHQAIIDLIHHYNWDHIIYLYHSHDGLLRLQKIFQSLRPAQAMFEIRVVRRVESAKDALTFLRTLENNSRWSEKYVVLDCSTEMAKSLIIGHVRDVHMGRRNYHYLLSGLVMDERWDDDVKEYGAVNITGFRIVDTTTPFVRDFLTTWATLDPNLFPGAGHSYISAQSALIYDAVRVVTEALTILKHKKVDPLTSSGGLGESGIISCNTDTDHSVWQHGDKITTQLRKVEMEGLTGHISFTAEGKRKDYSLDVVEMTFNSQTIRIGTWSDTQGLETVSVKYSNHMTDYVMINKSYIVTSILEKPFLMVRQGTNYTGNDRYEGYAKDLADLLAAFLGINYTLEVVSDNKYGDQNDDEYGGWDGMVGELVNQEADLAIGPLTITSSRERVIDFTKPFMTHGISIMIKKPTKEKPGVFSFLSPLSCEIWTCIVFAYVGVSIVLFLVTRFSPSEYKVLDSYDRLNVSKEFTFCNCLWFTMGTFMQQATYLCPRSVSGRMVGSAWGLFTLIIISSYTANLAAFLTIQRLVTPINSVDDLARQTDVEYGILHGGASMQFFKNSKISVYNRMWEFMSSRKHVFTSTYEEGIQRVRASKGKYAFLLESVKNDFINEQLPCDTINIGHNLNSNGYGVATPKHSPLKDNLNLAILSLKESGDLARLKNKWWFERSQCGKFTQDIHSDSLTLSNVAGIFYILTGGLVFSMIVALIEFCWKSKMEANHTKLSLSDAMKAKARMSITGGKDLDNGTLYGGASQIVEGGVVRAANTHTQV